MDSSKGARRAAPLTERKAGSVPEPGATWTSAALAFCTTAALAVAYTWQLPRSAPLDGESLFALVMIAMAEYPLLIVSVAYATILSEKGSKVSRVVTFLVVVIVLFGGSRARHHSHPMDFAIVVGMVGWAVLSRVVLLALAGRDADAAARRAMALVEDQAQLMSLFLTTVLGLSILGFVGIVAAEHAFGLRIEPNDWATAWHGPRADSDELERMLVEDALLIAGAFYFSLRAVVDGYDNSPLLARAGRRLLDRPWLPFKQTHVDEPTKAEKPTQDRKGKRNRKRA